MNFRGTRVVKNKYYSQVITVNINRRSSKIKHNEEKSFLPLMPSELSVC